MSEYAPTESGWGGAPEGWTEGYPSAEPQAEYPVLSLIERAIEASIVSVICVVALVGNLSLWYVVCSKRSLRTTSNCLVLCLSTADILVSAVNMPVTIYTIAGGRWMLSDGACVIFGFISMVTFIASVMSLGVISINRYFMICQPNKFRSLYTKRNTAFFIVGTWALSLALASPPLYGWGRYGYLPNQSFCFADWKTSVTYTYFMVGTCFGGPCSVMTVSYFLIMREIRASRRRIAANAEKQLGTPSEPGGSKRVTNTARSSSVKERPVSTISLAADTQGALKRTGCNLENRTNVRKSLWQGASSNVATAQQRALWQGASSNMVTPQQRAPADGKHDSNIRLVSSKRNVKLLTPVRVKESTLASPALLKARKSEKRRKENIRLAMSFLVVIFVFVICWLPFCITMFLSVYSSRPIPRGPDIFTLLLGFFNSLCNPIIYGAMNSRFRSGFRKLYVKPCRRMCPLSSRSGMVTIGGDTFTETAT